MGNLRNNVVKYSIVLSVGILSSRFFVFLFRLIAARELPLEDYGKLALIISFYTNLIILSHFQVNSALAHFISKFNVRDKNQIPSYFFNALLCILPTIAVSSAIFLFLMWEYGVLTLGTGLLSILMFFSYSIAHHNKGFLKGLKKFWETAAVNFSLGFSRFILLVPVFYLFNIISFDSAFYVFALSLMISVVVSVYYSLKNIKLSFNIDWGVIKKIYSYSLLSTVSYLGSAVLLLIPPFLLSLESMGDVALLDMALVFIGVIDLVLMNLTEATNPLVSENFAGNNLKPKIPLKTMSIAFLGLFVFLLIVYAADVDSFFITSILGEKYAPSIMLLRIASLSLPFTVHYVVVKGVLQGMNKLRPLVRIDVMTLVFSLPLFYLLNTYGPTGLSYALVLACTIRSALTYQVFRKLKV